MTAPIVGRVTREPNETPERIIQALASGDRVIEHRRKVAGQLWTRLAELSR